MAGNVSRASLAFLIMKFSNYREFFCKFEVEHDDFEILSARKFYKRFQWKTVKVSMIFLEASPRG